MQLHDAAAGAGNVGPARPLDPGTSAWADAVRKELCASMWRNCGIVRRRQGLKVCALRAVARMREHP